MKRETTEQLEARFENLRRYYENNLTEGLVNADEMDGFASRQRAIGVEQALEILGLEVAGINVKEDE